MMTDRNTLPEPWPSLGSCPSSCRDRWRTGADHAGRVFCL